MSESVASNLIDGYGSLPGILAENALNNTYDCNEFAATTDGISILYNAEGQTIRGNHFLDSDIDLSIRSELGIQRHHGNRFVNGKTRAIDLNDGEIENSLFFVNETIPHHMPADPEPAEGWFIPENDRDDFYSCSEPPGPESKFHEDEEKLLAYFARVRGLENTQPNRFKTKLYHLLQYEEEIPDYILPSIIRQDGTLANACSLHELANLSQRLKQRILPDAALAASYERLKPYEQAYERASGVAERETAVKKIVEEMLAVLPTLTTEATVDTQSAAELNNEVEQIACHNTYEVFWATVYIAYLDYIQKGEVTDEYHKTLIECSKACADEYGDAVHLARVLANTFDPTYFGAYDDCLEAVKPKRKLQILTPKKPLHAVVHPNPNKGAFLIQIQQPVSGMLQLTDLSGKKVYAVALLDAIAHSFQLNVPEGLYVLQLTSETGEVFTSKVVVAH